jgi:hypothetical protein
MGFVRQCKIVVAAAASHPRAADFAAIGPAHRRVPRVRGHAQYASRQDKSAVFQFYLLPPLNSTI